MNKRPNVPIIQIRLGHMQKMGFFPLMSSCSRMSPDDCLLCRCRVWHQLVTLLPNSALDFSSLYAGADTFSHLLWARYFFVKSMGDSMFFLNHYMTVGEWNILFCVYMCIITVVGYLTFCACLQDMVIILSDDYIRFCIGFRSI